MFFFSIACLKVGFFEVVLVCFKTKEDKFLTPLLSSPLDGATFAKFSHIPDFHSSFLRFRGKRFIGGASLKFPFLGKKNAFFSGFCEGLSGF